MPELPGSEIAEKLKYGGPFHGELLTKLKSMRELSDRHLADRKSTWAEIDRSLRGYIDLSAMAKLADGTRSTKEVEMPVERAIVIPARAAMLDVRRAQYLSIYNGRVPRFQIKGTEGTDAKTARGMEMNLEYDMRATSFMVQGSTFFRDIDRYGEGWFYNTWQRERGMKLSGPVFKGLEGFRAQFEPMLGGDPGMIQRAFGMAQQVYPQLFEPKREWGVKREFNLVRCVDPTLMVTDPRGKKANPTDTMSFCGHVDYLRWTDLVRNSVQNGGLFFNLEDAKKVAEGRTGEGDESIITKPKDRTHTKAYSSDTGSFETLWLTWEAIPSEHGFGEGTYPELWQFVVVNDAVIIGAWILDHDHGRMPYVCGEGSPDAHASWNPGMAELSDGIQRMMDFLYSVTAEQQRKALHNAGLVHEDLVEIEDILFPTPGGHIRVSDEVKDAVLAGRMSLASAFHQLDWHDSTQGYIALAMSLYEFGMRLMATNDPAQGMLTEDKRTLGEVQAIMAAASARVAASAQVLDEQAIEPLVNMMIANLQQYMSTARWVRILGDYQKDFGGAEVVAMRREDLYGNYDYTPIDGTMPADPSRQAESVMRLMEVAGANPMLNSQMATPDGSLIQFNYYKAIRELASILGFTNPDEFLQVIGPPQVMGPEAIASGVQAGDLVGAEELLAAGAA